MFSFICTGRNSKLLFRYLDSNFFYNTRINSFIACSFSQFSHTGFWVRPPLSWKTSPGRCVRPFRHPIPYILMMCVKKRGGGGWKNQQRGVYLCSHLPATLTGRRRVFVCFWRVLGPSIVWWSSSALHKTSTTTSPHTNSNQKTADDILDFNGARQIQQTRSTCSGHEMEYSAACNTISEGLNVISVGGSAQLLMRSPSIARVCHKWFLRAK